LFSDAGLPPLWENYCLKGSQVDFATATGIPIRLGNSVIESAGPPLQSQPQDSFVPTSSCMTCHARASVNSAGRRVTSAGFIDPQVPALCPGNQAACSPNGSPNPAWLWNNPGQPNQTMTALQTDFIWSVARSAIGP
jgi:hypothetical protein